MAEEVIVKISLEKGDNERAVDSFTKKITELTKANNDLKKSNNELIKSGQENSKEFIENTRQMEINKQKIQEATASRKNLITTLIAEDDSIKGLKARNAELIKQRDQLSTSTEDGKNKIAAINRELDINNKTIAKNTDELGKQKINIGNYKSALDGIVPGLGGFVSGLEGAVSAAKAFIATPIGLVLAAVAAALALVTTFFKSTQEGADLLEDALTVVSTVLDVVTDRIGRFISGIVSIVNGNFEEGLTKIEGAFSGIGDEMEREIGLALELNEAMRDLEDQEIRTAVNAAETENQIKRLLLQSRDRSKSEAERIKLLEQATALEKQVNDEEINNRTEALRIANQQAAQRLNIIKEVGETEIAFGKRVLEEFTKDNAVQADDLRDNVKDSVLAISGAEGQAIGILEKIQNQRAALEEKAEAEREKRAEAERKRQEKALEDAIKHQEELAALDDASEAAQQERFERIRTAEQSIEETRLQQKIKDAEDLQTRVQAEIELEQFKLDAFISSNELFNAEKEAAIAKSEANITAIRKRGADEQAKNDKAASDASAKVEKQNQDQITRGRQATAQAAITFARAVFGNTKAGAVAEGTINTILGVTRALKDYIAPYSFIVAALVGAAGAVQVAKIAGIEFFRGGLLKLFGLGGIARTGGVLQGRSHAQGGIPFTINGVHGFEAEGNEAIINKRSTAMFRPLLSQINQAGGGVAFGHGGVTKFQTGALTSQTQSAAAVAGSRQQLRDSVLSAIESMGPIIVTVEDINARSEEVSEQTNRAIVV